MKNTYFPVANLNDLNEGEMKQVNADGTDILIAKIDGKVFAVGAHCTHYGAPLAKGALCGKHVICPWHHAWFDLTNGHLLEPPALDALPRYDVDIKDNQIYVGLPEERTEHKLPSMSCSDPKPDPRSFIILGGGAAGYAAAQTLREDGFKGKITMITQEKQLPYDRPMLSKNYLQGKVTQKDIPLRPEDFFSTYSIDVLSEKVAKEVDHENKEITFENGERLKYDSLLVATGGIPRKMDLPGADLSNIFVLRSLDSAETIVNAVADVKKVVVVGASFIGMEAAASLTVRGLSVTIVAPGKVPFEKTLGPEIGTYFKKLHEEHGVQFELGTHVKNFEGHHKVSAVVLESGKRLEADAVITGIGVNPATDILKNIEKQKDGGVVTDGYLSLAPGLYAAGDIAAVPDPHTQQPRRIEHWRYALQQGFAAAHNMAGKDQAFTGVPFFWTAHFGVSLRYLGHAEGWDEIFYDGDIPSKKFLAFYIKNGRITAIAGIGRDKEIAYMEQLFKDGKMPSAFDLKQNGYSQTFGSLIN